MDRYKFTDQLCDCEIDGQTQHHINIKLTMQSFWLGLACLQGVNEAELKWLSVFDLAL